MVYWMCGTDTTALEARVAELEQLSEELSSYVQPALALQASIRESIADLADRVPTTVIIYPNGTPTSPGTISLGNDTPLVAANPFPGYHVNCVVELLQDGVWSSASFVYDGGGIGVRASQLLPDDQINIQAGNKALLARGSFAGTTAYSGAIVATPLPIRVIVTRLGRYYAQGETVTAEYFSGANIIGPCVGTVLTGEAPYQITICEEDSNPGGTHDFRRFIAYRIESDFPVLGNPKNGSLSLGVYMPGDVVTLYGPAKLYTEDYQSASGVFRVRYNLNGGIVDENTVYTETYDTTEVATYTPTQVPVRPGYTFIEWNSEPDGSGISYPVGNPVQIAGSINVLSAVWEEV